MNVLTINLHIFLIFSIVACGSSFAYEGAQVDYRSARLRIESACYTCVNLSRGRLVKALNDLRNTIDKGYYVEAAYLVLVGGYVTLAMKFHKHEEFERKIYLRKGADILLGLLGGSSDKELKGLLKPLLKTLRRLEWMMENSELSSWPAYEKALANVKAYLHTKYFQLGQAELENGNLQSAKRMFIESWSVTTRSEKPEIKERILQLVNASGESYEVDKVANELANLSEKRVETPFKKE